ncbi:hypothetical protein DV872_05655 [Oceanispirochaeta sp. M1]|nr:hypothetical protein DV872_05655 [Oceanispirochaeta sp. M1]
MSAKVYIILQLNHPVLELFSWLKTGSPTLDGYHLSQDLNKFKLDKNSSHCFGKINTHESKEGLKACEADAGDCPGGI